jgi:general secretion pathway protein J
MNSAQHRTRPTAQGFTLVEVLVALTVMAVLAGMAWQGIDAMARTREASQTAVDRTLRLGSVLAQWEADLQALSATAVVPALQFDGQGLRLTREAAGGVRVVVWSLRPAGGQGLWQRWQGPTVTDVTSLREQWLQSQQLLGNEPGTITMLDGALSLQVYFHRDNAWTNAQSSGDLATAQPAEGGTNASTGAGSASGSGVNAGTGGGASAATPAQEKLPNAVRLVLNLAPGALTRDILLGPQP